MTTYELILLLHIILFCYWLGGDIGVFYSSNFVVNDDLSRETRLTAAKIMPVSYTHLTLPTSDLV